MFGYKYIVSVVLLLSSLFSLNAAFAEESQSTAIIPKIETYMWNDALVVSLQGNSVNNEFTSKRYDIEYIQVPETSKDSDIKELSPQYSPIDTYKIIGDTHYSILPRPQIGKIYSFHVFLLGEDGITRIAYAIFDVKIPQYSLKKSGKITFTKAIRTNVIPHVMNRDFASALGFPLSWDLSANGIVRMSSLTQSSGAVLPLGTQFIINPLFHWINGPLSFAFQQEYQYANNWIVQKTANIVHDIVLSAAPVAQNNTTTSTPVSSSSTPTPVSSSSSSSSSSSGTPPPTNTGSANTSSTNTGSTNTGSTNTGSTSTGSTNTGSTSTGSTSTGSTSTGSTSTGSTNTGSTSTGSSNTGSTTPPPPPTNYTLSIVPTGSGTISSSPAGISCGTSGSSCSAIFLSGTIVTLTQTTDSGSTFSGWNGACTGTGSCIVNMTQAQTVGASFTLIPPPPPPPTNYTLFVFPTGSGTISSSPAGISCGTSGSSCSTPFLSGSLITLTPVADSGSTFTGWNGACTGTGSCTVNMTSDQSVGADFAIIVPHEGLSSWSDNFLYNTEVASTNLVRKTTLHTYKLDHTVNSIVPFPSHSGTTFSQLNVVNNTTYTGAFPQDKGTMEFWIHGSFSGMQHKTIVDNYDSLRNHIFLRTYTGSSVGATLQIAFQKANGAYVYGYGLAIPDNIWSSVVITWDMTLPTATASVYLNGTLQGTGTISDSSWRPDAQSLLLGGSFSGQIHDFRVMDSALSTNIVEADYGIDYVSSGQIFSKEIAPISLSKWQQLIVNANTPTNTQFSTSIEYLSGSTWIMVPEIYLPGNASGFTSFPVSLNLLPVNIFSKLRMKGNFSTTDSLVSPELLDWKVTWDSAFTGHKRMLLDLNRIALIKSRIDANIEPYKSQWLAVQARADQYIAETPYTYGQGWFLTPAGLSAVRGVGDRIPYMAIAYLITEDPKYFTGTKKWMDAILTYTNIPGADDLGGAHTLIGMSLGYDWLYDQFSPIDRANYEQKMDYQVKILIDAIKRPTPIWWAHGYAGNHNTIDVLGILATAVALYDHMDNADQYIKLAYDNYTNALEDIRTDGSTEEGISYWSYGMQAMLMAFDLEKGIYGTDRSILSSSLQKATTYRLYGSLPNYWKTILIGDSVGYDYYGATFLLRRFATMFNDPLAQWLGSIINTKKTLDNIAIDPDWRNLLWYDETIPEQDPVSLSLPTYHFFDDMNIFTSRSDWNDDNAVFFTFKAGAPLGLTPGGAATHAHPDEGQVSLDAYGKPLIIDDGYPLMKLTSNHNVATFDGSGQTTEGMVYFNNTNMGSGAMIYQDINTAAGYEYLIADLKNIYKTDLGITKYIRHAIFLKKNTVVMFDEIETSLSHDIEWRLHLNQDSNFSLSGTNLFGTISGSTVGMNIDDISEGVHVPSITKEDITSAFQSGSFVFHTNTYMLKHTGTGAQFDAVIRPFASGGTRSSLEFTRSGGVITIKLDDGSYTSISTATRQVQMNVAPPINFLKTFIATSPYTVLVNGTSTGVDLAGMPRTFDFVSMGAFINTGSTVRDLGTIQANGTTIAATMTNAGIPGHIEYLSGMLGIRTVSGDAITAGKCRSQVSSFPIPSRQHLYWDMLVQLGSSISGEEWTLTTPNISPTLIWQLKHATVGSPPLAIIADTDDLDSSKLSLSFNRNGGTSSGVIKDGVLHGLDRHVPVHIFIEAYIDEREAVDGGQGYWKIWANNQLVVNTTAPTISSLATDPALMTAATYMYNDADCTGKYRVTYWDKLQMMVNK